MNLSDAFPKEVIEPSGESPALGPRSKGWKTVKKELIHDPSGVDIEKTWRIRSFGILKNAFLREMAKVAEEKRERPSFLRHLGAGAGMGAGAGAAAVPLWMINQMVEGVRRYGLRPQLRDMRRSMEWGEVAKDLVLGGGRFAAIGAPIGAAIGAGVWSAKKLFGRKSETEKKAFLEELKKRKHGIPARMRMRISAMLRRLR